MDFSTPTSPIGFGTELPPSIQNGLGMKTLTMKKSKEYLDLKTLNDSSYPSSTFHLTFEKHI